MLVEVGEGVFTRGGEAVLRNASPRRIGMCGRRFAVACCGQIVHKERNGGLEWVLRVRLQRHGHGEVGR